MSNKLSSDDMIAHVLTRDADIYLNKVKYLTSLTADEIKFFIIKNNNNCNSCYLSNIPNRGDCEVGTLFLKTSLTDDG
jgi:hypothetical protein